MSYKWPVPLIMTSRSPATWSYGLELPAESITHVLFEITVQFEANITTKQDNLSPSNLCVYLK